MILDHTTVAGNQASVSGGISGDVITLTNSTVTNNLARADNALGIAGGILYNGTGRLTLINSVVSNNAPNGISRRGTFPTKDIVTFDNSIIANNGAQSCIEKEGVSFTGRNISSDNTCGVSALNMLVVDPLLGPLADNGGPTQTRALDRNSPAINATDCRDDHGRPALCRARFEVRHWRVRVRLHDRHTHGQRDRTGRSEDRNRGGRGHREMQPRRDVRPRR